MLFQEYRLRVARPVQFFVTSLETHETFSHVADRAIVEGNFLLLLDKEGKEAERYNMTSSSFDSLEWLDIEKGVSFSQYGTEEDKKEYARILYSSPKYKGLRFKNINGVTYDTKRPECKDCDIQGLVCVGCPNSAFLTCEECQQNPKCNCPQFQKLIGKKEAV